MRICFVLLILFNSAFLFGKSSGFEHRTIAVDGDSTSVFKPQRELYFSCFSPLQALGNNYYIWRYSIEVAYSKTINKSTTLSHCLMFRGFNRNNDPYYHSGEFYEFTLSHRLNLNKRKTFYFDLGYGLFIGNFRIPNSYYSSGIGLVNERIINFGIGPSFKAEFNYKISKWFCLNISSNYRTYCGWGQTDDPYSYNGFVFGIYPFWHFLQFGVDIILPEKK